MSALLDDAAITAALADLPDWTRDGDSIVLTVTADGFPAAIDLVNRVAAAAEAADHHPDIDIRWATVRFVCSSHSAGGLTEQDIALAREISAAAAVVGATTQS